MSVRLFHKNARLVVVVRREQTETTRERWLSVHLTSHPWRRILETALGRLDLPASGSEPAPDTLAFALGELRWTGGRYWTTISLALNRAPLRKRQLIASALLRAARYQLT
jgi:hypothetical protein